MFDYLLRFTDEAAAFAAMADTEWVGLDDAGGQIWATRRQGSAIMPIVPILADAVYDNTDPDKPVLVSPQINSPNFWRILMVPGRDVTLQSLPGCIHETDREAALRGEIFLKWTKLTLAEMNTVIRMAPMPAGSDYPFGVAP